MLAQARPPMINHLTSIQKIQPNATSKYLKIHNSSVFGWHHQGMHGLNTTSCIKAVVSKVIVSQARPHQI